MLAAGFRGIFALEYEQGPLDGVEGAQYFYREVLAALTNPTPVISDTSVDNDVMTWLYTSLRRSRRMANVGAWLASAVFFALLHLPSYDWNLLQVLLLIGLARLVLTLAYITTKNIWVSTGAHVLNDWLFFAVSLLGTRLAAG